MAGEPDELLGDVGAVGEQRDLLREAAGIDRRASLASSASSEQLVEALVQARLHALGRRRAASSAICLAQRGELVEPRA